MAERMKNTKYGRRREGRWTPIRAKVQDTRANPNSWETHLVRKRWDIGLLRALSLWIMMMMMMKAPLTELVIQRCSQCGSPEEIRMSSDNESKRVAAQLGSYCKLLEDVIPHSRTHTGKGTVLGQT